MLEWGQELLQFLLIITHVIITSLIIIMAAGTIMVGIIAAVTIIMEDKDIEVVTTITADIVTIMDNAIELQVVDTGTIIAEAIIAGHRTTEVEVTTVDTNKRGY